MMWRLVVAASLAACGGGSEAEPQADAAAVAFSECTGDCRRNDATARFDNVERTFVHAYFGLTAPGQTGSGAWEIYVEVAVGGDGQCPTETAPTPDALLIIAGIPAADMAHTVTLSDGGAVTVIDFEGALIPEGSPIARASSLSVTLAAAFACTECAGGSPPAQERFVAMDVESTFELGSATGHLFATHCDSLDTL